MPPPGVYTIQSASPRKLNSWLSVVLPRQRLPIRDELEGALAVQMACTHTAALAVLAKMDSGFGTERRIAAFGSTAARLMKTFVMQIELLRRLRNGGQQFVRVEHVHVNDGGQAVIGNVKKSDL
jgi:hypothetical protein